jgi:ceramide glucosyltransferase
MTTSSAPVTVLFLVVAAIPFIYYAIAIFSCVRFFGQAKRPHARGAFTPPVSILKPIRGLDPDAYENFASFCRQDYPEYEVVFCVDENDPSLPVLERLERDFPQCRIRVLYGAGRRATNDKVAKLARLVSEARYEYVVISDSDVRARPDYLRSVVAPMANPKIGAVTCFYVPAEEGNLIDRLQSVGMMADFYPGIVVAWQLDGIKFALGPTIATTRARLEGFGGYAAIENRPGDDLLVGRLIADQGYEVELLPYPVATVADFQSWRELIHKRLRWIVVMRHMRPWGHLGLLLTQGLPWSLVAIAMHPTVEVAAIYLGLYLALRLTITGLVYRGLRQPDFWKRAWMIAPWDAVAFAIWLASFARRSVRWRGSDYYIRDGILVPVTQASIQR